MPQLPSIDEARATLLAVVRPLEPTNVAVNDALGLVLAEDVSAAHDVPAFANSAMDGFAVRAGQAGQRLRISGESRAGAPYDQTIVDGEAVRISTGAALPAGADGVLQIELVELDGDEAVTLTEAVEPGRNVRDPGTDLRAGAVVLRAGTRIGPAELGVAIGAGRQGVLAAPRPRVAIVTTGDELVEAGAPLQPGQIHDSNGPTLAGLAARAGAEVVGRGHAVDDPEATRAVIAEALDVADVLVLAGGVSVGPHDHVKPALTDLGVEELLWRVALRPGKPTWLGHRGDQLVFGLPGNPVSAYVTFLLFARPALNALQGADATVPRTRATLAVAVPRHPDRDECVRVRRRADGSVEPTGPQGSHVLSSLLGAEALAIVPRGEGDLPAGSDVTLEPV
ncbi:molybdopterin molybdotransferase MoeA [Baekduia alba]|uniref:molybdopterin molybdotransferase MoeA n=1 Tax=Baekduia alba TaxID=2997333 RepID=UPI0023421CB4|nr:gephyrin-like molybdotransferase Glp [Baekduia alba]